MKYFSFYSNNEAQNEPNNVVPMALMKRMASNHASYCISSSLLYYSFYNRYSYLGASIKEKPKSFILLNGNII